MPMSITFTTDDPALASRLLQVIQGGVPTDIKPAAAAPPAPPPTQAAIPHAGNSVTPPSQPTAPQFAQPPTGVGMPGQPPAAAPQAGLQQAIEATNSALDKFLQAHKAPEAKAILQKYGLKRISDAQDMAVLQNLHREFSA